MQMCPSVHSFTFCSGMTGPLDERTAAISHKWWRCYLPTFAKKRERQREKPGCPTSVESDDLHASPKMPKLIMQCHSWSVNKQSEIMLLRSPTCSAWIQLHRAQTYESLQRIASLPERLTRPFISSGGCLFFFLFFNQKKEKQLPSNGHISSSQNLSCWTM